VDVIGVHEYSSIAEGVRAMDAMVKKAPVTVLAARTVTPGRFVVLITGDEASVEASLAEARETSLPFLLDELYLPNLHPRVLPAIRGEASVGAWDAMGLIESSSVTAGIEAADAAAKEADVRLLSVRLSGGLGGKSVVKLMGALSDVEAAVEAGAARAQARGRLAHRVVIARPHPDLEGAGREDLWS